MIPFFSHLIISSWSRSKVATPGVWAEPTSELPARWRKVLATSRPCIDVEVKTLRLSQPSYSLWLSQPQSEKRKLLDLLLLNCIFDVKKGDSQPVWIEVHVPRATDLVAREEHA